jgi:SAM-dependent methyltransferase
VGNVFGEVASVYDEARPGYPHQLRRFLLDYHGGPPHQVVEVGAGTGKGTELLVGLGAPITCVEPDERMAAVLRGKFPQVSVVVDTFEGWSPPAGGVEMLASAMSWHLLDPARRCRSARDALAPGGTLAVFAHQYEYHHEHQRRLMKAVFASVEPPIHDRPANWFLDEIEASGLFADLRIERVVSHLPLSTHGQLALLQTFSSFRRRPPDQRNRLLDAVASVVDGLGGEIMLELRTTLVLARRSPSH